MGGGGGSAWGVGSGTFITGFVLRVCGCGGCHRLVVRADLVTGQEYSKGV